MPLLNQPAPDLARETDETRRLAHAIMLEMWALYGQCGTLNWAGIESHLGRIVRWARRGDRVSPVVFVTTGTTARTRADQPRRPVAYRSDGQLRRAPMTRALERPSSRLSRPAEAATRVVADIPAAIRFGVNGAAHHGEEELRVQPVLAPEPGRMERSRVIRNVAAGAAHDLGNLLCIMGFSLDHLASEQLSSKGADAVSSLRAEVSYLRGLTRELQMAATESEAPSSNPRTRLAAWWPDMRRLLRAIHGNSVIIRADIPGACPPCASGPAT
jgi:hypothetical protein